MKSCVRGAGIRRPAVTSLQAVLLLGAAFLVTLGLMDVWQANAGTLNDKFAKTIRGETDGTTPAAGGGPSTPDPGPASTPPPTPTNSPPASPSRDEGAVESALPSGLDVAGAVFGNIESKLGDLAKTSGSAGAGLGAAAAGVLSTATDVIEAGGNILDAASRGDDRGVIVGTFEGLGAVLIDKVAGPIVNRIPLGGVVSDGIGEAIGGAIGNAVADGGELIAAGIHDAIVWGTGMDKPYLLGGKPVPGQQRYEPGPDR